MEEPTELTVSLAIHHTDYQVRVRADRNALHLELEDKHSGDFWKNSFSQHYIEEITQKTGNYKKFQVLVKMLLDGLQKKTDALLVDILTMQDLHNMKTRQQGPPPAGTSSNQKRYLILSYLVEYDKVHYPLPLILDENPDVESLKKTIRRLRFENDDLKEKASRRTNSMGISQNNFNPSQPNNSQMVLNSEAYKELLRQNQKLQADLDAMRQQQQGALAFDDHQQNNAALIKEYQQTKEKHMREICRLQNELEMREAMASQEDQSALVKQVSQQKKTIDQLEMELSNAQAQMKKQAQQIKLLQDDLKIALNNKRGNSVTDRLYNNPRSKGNTPSVISKASAQSRPSYQRQTKVISTQSRATSQDSKAQSVKQWDRKAPQRKPLYPSPGIKQQQNRREEVARRQLEQMKQQNKPQKVLSTSRNKYSPAHSLGSGKRSNYSYSSYNSNTLNMNRVKTTIDNRKKDNNIFKRNNDQPDFIARNKKLFGTSSQNSKSSRNAPSFKNRSPGVPARKMQVSPAQRPKQVSPAQRPQHVSPMQRLAQPKTRASPQGSKGSRTKSPYINNTNLNNHKYNDNHMQRPTNTLQVKTKDENLLQKLEDLKNRNNSNSKPDSKNIEDRLSKLQELLRMAKS